MFVAGGLLSLNILPTDQHQISWMGHRSGFVKVYIDQAASYGWPVAAAEVTSRQSQQEIRFTPAEIEVLECIDPNSFMDGSFSGSIPFEKFASRAPSLVGRLDFKIEREPDLFHDVPIVVNLAVACMLLALAAAGFERYMRPFYNSVRRRRRARQ